MQINRAFDHIAEDNPAAAKAFMARIESIVSLLSGYPGMGRATSKAGVQVIGLLPYRYLLFYKVLEQRDEIRIVRVRHTSRKDAIDVRGL
jgi:plasmid stabilization system protein ParE